MAEQVGGIYYDVRLETGQLLRDQRQVEGALRATENAGSRLQANFNALAVAVKILAVAIAAVKAAEKADEMRLLGARVEVAAGSVDKGVEAMNRLVQISRNTQTAVVGNVEVFNRLNQSLLQMGGTQNDTLNLTDLLAKAIRVSGASAVEAKSAMLQFGQALGSGKLAGDELRSLLENAPYLMQQLAAGIGKPVGELKKLGEQGKLTADVVVAALTKSAEKINADFAKFPQTVSGGFQLVQDAAARLNEKMDQASGKSAALAGAAQGLAQVLDTLTGEFAGANTEAEKLGRNKAIQGWAQETKIFLSYVADAADVTWQALSVLGRNVAFVFQGIGTEIGGIGAQVSAVLRGDFSGAVEIGRAMREDADKRRAELDASDAKTLANRKLMGQRMREAWEQGAKETRGFTPAPDAPSKLKPPKDDDEARKLAAKTAAAKAYYEGLVAENAIALAKIEAEERKALDENKRRASEDKGNQQIYAAARLEIIKKFARERGKLEEQTTQQVADLNIAITTDEAKKIDMVQQEAIRRADAAVKLGTITHAEGERAKTLATFNGEKERAVLEDRNAKARYEAAMVLTKSHEGRIAITRDEAVREAEAAYKRGAMTFEEAEAKKTAAAENAVAQLRQLQADRANTQISTLQLRVSATGDVADQVGLIRAEAAARLEANQQAWLLDLENSRIYADQKVAIELDMNERIRRARADADATSLSSMSSALGQMTSVLKSSATEQSAVYSAMFAAQKAFSIASAIVSINKAVADVAASEATWPTKLMAMASITAATASIVGTISGVNYGGGRQYGGPVSPGSLYRVNEKGPEMFVGNNGSQYMMPSAGGRVMPADQAAGGNSLNVQIINQHPTARVMQQPTDKEGMLRFVIAELSTQVANNEGQFFSALLASTNVRPGGLS